MWRVCNRVLLGLLISLVLSSCSESERVVKTLLAGTVEVPTPVSTPVVNHGDIVVTKVSEPRVQFFKWSEDGASLIYAHLPLNTCCDPAARQWWRVDRSSGQQIPISEQLNTPDDKLDLSQLTDRPSILQQLSPDGRHVIYLRKPVGYSPPKPVPPMYRDPLEVWAANVDGKDAVRLWSDTDYSCDGFSHVQWISNSQRVLVECAFGDGGDIHRIIAGIDGREQISLEKWIGFDNDTKPPFNYDRPTAVVSPDEKKVAFNYGPSGELWIGYPADRQSPQKIAGSGFDPKWGLSNQRVYYLVAKTGLGAPSIYVYDFQQNASRLLLDQTVLTKISPSLTIAPTSFNWSVSPREDAIAIMIDDGSLWLISLPQAVSLPP